MKKSTKILALTTFLGLLGTNVYAQAFVADFLAKMRVIDGGDGRTLDTYEDTDPVTFDPYGANNTTIKLFKISSIPEGYVSMAEGKKWMNTVIAGSVASEDYSSVSDLLMDKFYLDFGSEQNGVWVSRAIGKAGPADAASIEGLPHQYSESGQPKSQRFYLCMNGGYEYVVNSTPYSPDAISCNVCQRLCNNCPERTIPGTNNVTAGRRIPDRVVVNHRYAYNIYENFRENLLAHTEMVTARDIAGRDSGQFVQINYADRTPPRILDCDNDKLPGLGNEPDIITTGDWCLAKGLKLKDNRAKVLKAKIVLGKIDEDFVPVQGSRWVNQEDWNTTNTQAPDTVLINQEDEEHGKYGEIQTTLIPNTNLGYMNYSVFAQDTEVDDNEFPTENDEGNFNPGCATIVEDSPETCYGLPDGPDLDKTPGRAKPFPHSARSNDSNKLQIESARGDDRIHTGLIKITDNDLPNLLIRITSAKDGSQIFFPPCMPQGELPIVCSPDYNNGINSNTNVQEYNSFVGPSIKDECNYQTVQASCKDPYYTIFDITSSKYMNANDASIRNQLLKNTDKDVINMQIRLEDQTESDTDTNGQPKYTTDNGGIGIRNGTWERIVAFVGPQTNSPIVLQEDVEYSIDFWFDDNVKWGNVYSLSDVNPIDNTEAYPTGVKSGEVTVNIPNQLPPVVNSRRSFDAARSSVATGLKLVFREPTKNDIEITSIEDLENNKFPSIEAKIEDYSGNTRTIKLYFRVLDEKAAIRTLERKHENH